MIDDDAYRAEQQFGGMANNTTTNCFQQVIALGEVVERSKNSGKHKAAEQEAQVQEDSANKVSCVYSSIQTCVS